MGPTTQVRFPASNASQSENVTERVARSRTGWLQHVINFSPFLLLVWFTASFGVNVPVYDDWWLVDWFRAVELRTATWSDLFALNNEHRIVFPKLIWTAAAFASHWNLGFVMALNVLLALIVFAPFYWIAMRQGKQTGSALSNPANFATSLIVFSLMQYENWLWGFGLANLLVPASVALAIGVCSLERIRPWLRFAWASLFCFVASFSAAQGLFSWLALLPCIGALPAGNRRVSRFYVWLLLFAATTAVYSYHFRFAMWAGDTSTDFLHRPLQSASFFLALLGAPFCLSTGPVPATAACIAGALILGFLLACVLAVRSHEPRDLIAPWIAVALFGLFFTATVTVARSNFGLGVALNQSRYMTGTLWVSIAALQLGRIVCEHSRRNVYLLLVGAACSLVMLSSVNSVSLARHVRDERLQARLFLNIIRYIDPATDSARESRLFPLFAMEGHTGYIRTPAETLSDLGFLHLASSVTFVERPSADYGAFEAVEPSGDLLHLRRNEEVTVSGWAMPGSRKTPTMVLISYGDRKAFITGAVVGGVNRPEIAALRRDAAYARSGWTASFPARFLMPGEGSLKAWVYDSAREEFIRLPEAGGEKKFRIEAQ